MPGDSSNVIYICIPSHNEERTIGILLWKIRQVLTAFPRDYQLLVLDDASDDRTPEVLAPYARILPLTVLRHEQRMGYAASLDELIREAVRRSEYPRRDVVLTLQADFTEEPDEIPALLKRIESGADIVTTRVRIAPEHAPRKVRWMRAGMTRLLRRLDWPENVTDMLSGLRAYRVIGLRKALEARGAARLMEWHDAWAANAALLRAVKPHVRRVDEVEAELRPDRLQRASRFDAWTTARQLARLAFGRDSATPVPARQGGAIVVSAEELAAAARDIRPPATAPARRGQGGARRGGAAAGAKGRGSRSETETGQTPPRGRRAKGERAQAAEPTGRAGRPERPEQSERGDRPEKTPRRSRARASRPEPAADTMDAALETGMPAAPKSRRRRRGAAATAEAADTTALSLEGIIADVLQGAAPAPAGIAPVPGAGAEGAPPAEGLAAEGVTAEGVPPVEVMTAEAASAQAASAQAAAAPGAQPGEDGAGAEENRAGGRKRRRRSSRRGRGRRERAGTSEGVEAGPVSTGKAPLEPSAPEQELAAAGGRPGGEPGALEGNSGGRGEAAPPEAPRNGGTAERAAGAGAAAGAEAPGDAAPAAGRPRRRSRRGGRGRSRRRAGAGAGAAGPEAQSGSADTNSGPAAQGPADPAPGAMRPLALLPPGRPEPPREAPPEPRGVAGADAGPTE